MTRLDWTRPQYCRECGHAMRPSRTTRAERPGTIQHGGNGLCQTCYGAHYKGKPRHLQPASRDAQRALARFLKDRRARGVPPEGFRSPHPRRRQITASTVRTSHV